MRRSPRRPLILRRRKLPFQQNDPPAAEPGNRPASGPEQASGPSPGWGFPDGVRVLDHPCVSDTKVVVIPKTADVQNVIQALSANGKDSGPSKFILLGGNAAPGPGPAAGQKEEEGSARNPACRSEEMTQRPPNKPAAALRTLNRDLERHPLDDSLASIQSLKEISASAVLPPPAKEKENLPPQAKKAGGDEPPAERPPYSYMALIQFAINSHRNRRMTLKEIYTWIEERFPYFRQVAKPGWKNSIRHNLSLHDMFIRETSLDGKISYWTIRPEANRCITLDQVCKTEADPAAVPVPVQMLLLSQQQQKRANQEQRHAPSGAEKRMKPLLPRADCYLVPIQLPVGSPVFLPACGAPFTLSSSRQRTSRGGKRVRIVPKVAQGDAPSAEPVKCEAPERPPQRAARSSRRKQRLVHSRQDEPVLLCPESTLFDSGVASDSGEAEPLQNRSPDQAFSFKTPVKAGGRRLTSSTPSRPPAEDAAPPWKVTPVGKGTVLDFSPIRTPGGPAVTPQRDYTTFSLDSTPFKELPLLGSPREPQGGNQSLTEGLMLDLMNDSLSKILVDISFPGLEDEDMAMANISWSELLPQLK